MPRVIANTANMSREEWLYHRMFGIGGSDAGIILGVNKYQTAFELWMNKTGQIIPEDKTNDAIHWGNVLEDVVAKEFERVTSKKVRRKNKMLRHDEHEFMIANLDRVVVGENALLECKTANAFLAKEWEGDEIPAQYLVQINHYMAVTGYEKAYIACLIGGQKFVWKEVKRDEELITIIIEAEKRFWEHNVLTKIPPALDGSSAAEKYIKERFVRAQKGKTVDLKAEHKDNIEKYFLYKSQVKEFETEVKRLENLIKLDLEDAESGIVERFTVNWKNVSSNRVDSKALKEKYPDVYESVCKTSNSRRFEIKEEK